MKPITTREDANRALERLASLSRQAEAIRARAAAQCDRIHRQAAGQIQPLLVEKVQTESLLRKWFRQEVRTLGDRRSLKLLCGTLKFHLSHKVVRLRGWTEEACLRALRSAGLEHYVRTRLSIDRDAILSHTARDDEQLAQCGLRVARSGSFSIDLDPADTQERLNV